MNQITAQHYGRGSAMFSNLGRQNELEYATGLVNATLNARTDLIGHHINGVRFNSSGDVAVNAQLLSRDADGIKLVSVMYMVINKVMYCALPENALCDNK